MAKMKAVQVSKAGGDFEIVEREIPEPGPGQVRIKVEACGVCHSDSFVKEGYWPGIQYPRVPGHEVTGVIDAVGANVTLWRPGQRVGVGWHGGHCFKCEFCRRGDFILCRVQKIAGISYDGGYQEYMTAPEEAVAGLPDGISADEAAPLLCAGVTTFNSLRNAGARAGDLVAVQGLGGLGHLGVQFANKMGFHTIAIARGQEKEPLAKQLGAAQYIDSASTDAAKELQKLGGARLILATAPDSKAISSMLDGLGANGKLLVVAAPGQPLEVNPITLISGRRTVQGWPSGIATDSEDTLRFCGQTGVRPMIERYPLDRAAEGYERMISSKVRFRVVLTMG
jgi:D-arabinose 1-dehydrogenase-like Zn-dependent alcohol dehydrogenase